MIRWRRADPSQKLPVLLLSAGHSKEGVTEGLPHFTKPCEMGAPQLYTNCRRDGLIHDTQAFVFMYTYIHISTTHIHAHMYTFSWHTPVSLLAICFLILLPLLSSCQPPQKSIRNSINQGANGSPRSVPYPPVPLPFPQVPERAHKPASYSQP